MKAQCLPGAVAGCAPRGRDPNENAQEVRDCRCAADSARHKRRVEGAQPERRMAALPDPAPYRVQTTAKSFSILFVSRTTFHSCPADEAFRYHLLRFRQIRCSHTGTIDSSTCNFSLVIYVFGAFEARSIATFEIVEVCGCIAVIPDNCTTINEVSIA